MKTIAIIFFLIGFTASAQRTQFIKITQNSTTIFVNDTSDYSKDYLEELMAWDLSTTYTLNRDTLFVNGGFGYGLFDTGIEKDKQYTFSGSNDLMAITLVVIRINFSTIEYQVEIKKDNEITTFYGEAHGGVSILGSESDTDNMTGESYFCSEYYSNWKHPKVTLRIDSEENNRAKVIIYDSLEITLKNCPTLVLME
jgi:hypothetical protein